MLVEYRIKDEDLKMVKMRLHDHTEAEIAREVKMHVGSVSRRLKELPQVYVGIRDLISKIEEDKEMLVFLLGETAPEKPQAKWARKQWEDGYHVGVPPYAYERDAAGNLKKIPEKAAVVKQIFEGVNRGKGIGELSRETELERNHVSKILRKPEYKGWVCRKGECHPSQHVEAIVSEKLWDSVQKIINRPFRAPLLYAYKYVDNCIVIDYEKAEEIKRMFKLRIEGISFSEIGRRLGWPPHSVWDRIRNPGYCGMKWKNGKLVKSDYPAIVNLKTWKAAVASKTKHKVERRERKLNESRIIAFIHREGLVTIRQICEELNLSERCVANHLHRLERGEEEVRVERLPPEYERKGAAPFPSKWRIIS